jgi:hypothetical protein
MYMQLLSYASTCICMLGLNVVFPLIVECARELHILICVKM